MSEQSEASKAPANAVEAEQGASPGETAPSHTTSPSHDASAPSPSDSTAVASENAEASSSSEESEAGDEGDESESGQEASSGEDGQTQDAQKKKRRRRRRKKGDKTGAPGAEAGAEGAPAERHEKAERAPREGAGGVFARFFDNASGGAKRHAFSAGEVVAGRVVRINDGAFVVDLFGKATAFVDIFEPHEVPTLPEPPAAPAAPPAEAAPAEGQAVAAEGDAGEVAGTAGTDESTPAAAIAEAQFGIQPTESTPIEAPTHEVEAAAGSDGATGPADGQAYGATVAASAFGSEELASSGADAEAAEHIEGASESNEEGAHEEGAHEEGAHEEVEAEPEPAPPPPPEVGTIFRGRIGSVAESGHVVLVNRIIDTQAAKQRVVRAREQRQRVRGVVYGFNRGGFDVLVEGVRVFCPASGMALAPIENPETVLGQRLEFTVPPAKAGTHGLVVSRRGILERQQRKQAKQLFRSLTPGQKLRGRVTQVREFGLFVDLGGFEGLVHQTELSFNRGVRPQDVAKPGDEVDVQVLRVGEGQTRKERERVSLSMKTLQADPWAEHNELLEPGNIIQGKVVRTTEFGAFIELAPSIEGLLHISEIGRDLKHANQALEEGASIRVIVERVDRKARRISLSKLSAGEEKALDAGIDPKSGKVPKPGAHIEVVVEKVEHQGLIVQIPGVFGRRGRGFIPNSEMGTERGTDHRRGFPQGTKVQVKVIGVDRDGGFRFSRKAVGFEEEKKAIQDYRREASRQGLGTFGDLLRAKLEGSKPNS